MTTEPIAYRSLAQDLREAILRGDYAHGERLPTEAELSAERGISRQTVRRALQDLVADGLIFRVRGRGTFASIPAGGGNSHVSQGVDDHPLMAIVSPDTTFEVVEPLRPGINVEAASRLRLSSDEVMTATVKRLHGQFAFGVTQIWLPPEPGRRIVETGMLEKTGSKNHETIIGVLERLWPETVVGAQQSITAASAPAWMAELLDLEPGAPTLRADRLYFDSAQRPVELATSHFHPERYSYRLQLRRSLNGTID
jgi:DNA-binding GntR family transcriptional regulator